MVFISKDDVSADSCFFIRTLLYIVLHNVNSVTNVRAVTALHFCFVLLIYIFEIYKIRPETKN